MNITTGSFEERLRKTITFAWQIFSEKVGAELIQINKEASMQLQYSHILQQVIPLICFCEGESAKVELETGIKIGQETKEIDLVVTGISNGRAHKIAVEMKCYRKYASSGGKRGATDIFMKDVYDDLQLLESYCNLAGFDRGIALVMNDLEHLVSFHPEKEQFFVTN